MGPLVKIKFLGEGFNKWIFPSLLLLTILLTAFDCIYRLLNCVGLRQFSFDEDYAEEKVIEGKAVIERYLKKKKQEEQLEGKLKGKKGRVDDEIEVDEGVFAVNSPKSSADATPLL